VSTPQHFLVIEGEMIRPTVICTAGPADPCHMVCDSCEESCTCDEPTLRDLGECNWILYLNNDDDVMECGAGVAHLPIDVEWNGENYEWTFTQPQNEAAQIVADFAKAVTS